MKIIEKVSLSIVQAHEKSNGANSVLGDYGMDEHCPPHEFECFKCLIEVHDVERLFLLGEFARHTSSQTGKTKDIEFDSLSRESKTRVNSFLDPDDASGFHPLDLPKSPALALVVVTSDLENGCYTTIDGNHRSIAHFLQTGSVDGVPVFICVHPKISNWGFVPRLAR